jgi:hypothetical protein
MAKVFMLSPFGDPFDKYFREVLKPGLQQHGHELARADESYAPGIIIYSIFRSILDSDVILAEVTRRKPNVFYELGIAHSYGKPTIIIAQSAKELPFDVRHMRCIEYDPSREGWQQTLIDRIAAAIKEATDPDRGSVSSLSEYVFSGKYLRRFDDVIDAATDMMARAKNYFFVSRTSPNEAILPHESGYFESTDRRIRGIDGVRQLPNYRRLVYLGTRDSLELALSFLDKYWQLPNFQMAAYGNPLFPINFEVFVADDELAILTFGAQQRGGPIDSGLYVRNSNFAAKWKFFFLNLWDYPETVVVKPSGSLSQEEYKAARDVLEGIFAKTKA